MRRVLALGFGVLSLAATSCDRGAFVSLMGAASANAHVDAARLPLRVAVELAAEAAAERALEAELAARAAEEVAPPVAGITPVDTEQADESLAHGAEDTDAEAEGESEEAARRIAEELRSAASDRPRLASIGRETWIYAEPRFKARRIGYLRAGAVVPRSQEAFTSTGCKGGWYRVGSTRDIAGVEPKGADSGYVCLGRTASLNPYHPIVDALDRRPKLDGIPYDYVMSRMPGAPLYRRIPTESEQKREEPDLEHHKRQARSIARDPSFVPVPEAEATHNSLLYGQMLPRFADLPPTDTFLVGKTGVRAGFALVSHFEDEGRMWGVTTDLGLLPLDRTRWIKPSVFRGLELKDDLTLPVGFVMKKRAQRWTKGEQGRMTAATPTTFREAIALTGQKDGEYREARDGTWVRASDVRVVEPMTRAPVWAKDGKRWLDVSILEQSLVAYEGDKAVYVTLVSTGAGGLGDPKTTHATVQGAFLIHTKHITTTMDGDESGDEFDLRDVPFVQYFNEGYALHAAYWHDDFGTPRSHGCVNLAPTDAAWLFSFTTPDVPAGWHGALSLKKGTIVYTHP